MYCHHCGKQIPDEDRFCSYCGAEQAMGEWGANAAAQAEPPSPPPAPAVTPAPVAPIAAPVAPAPITPATPVVQAAPVAPAAPAAPVTPTAPTAPAVPAAAPALKENVVLGTIGTLLGAFLGLVGVVFMETLFHFPYASGAILAVYVFLNWQLFGKTLGKVGLVVSGAVTAAAAYFSNLLLFGISVSSVADPMTHAFVYKFGVFGGVDTQDIFACIRAAQAAIAKDAALSACYYQNLIILLVSAVLGAAIIVYYTRRMRAQQGAAKPKRGMVFVVLLLLTVAIWGGGIALAGAGVGDANPGRIYTAVAQYADEQAQKLL